MGMESNYILDGIPFKHIFWLRIAFIITQEVFFPLVFISQTYFNPSEMEDDMKKCAWCKKEKEFTEFSIHKRNTDGYHSYCRKCCNERQKIKNKSPEQQQKIRKRDRIK